MTRRGKHGTGPVALQPAPGGAYNPPGRRLQPWLHPFIRREDLPCQAARRHGACRPAHPRFRAMILTCPACSTRYTLDPQSLGPDGRKVRCTQCGHVWHQDPPADMPRPLALPRDENPDEPASLYERRPVAMDMAPTRSPRWPAFTALGIVIAAMIGGLIVGREQVVRALPFTAAVYGTLGLGVGGEVLGLEVRNLVARGETVEGRPILEIDGEIYNLSDGVRAVPPLTIMYYGADGQELGTSSFSVSSNRMLPGEVLRFNQRVENPPREAVRFDVRFSAAE